VERSESMASATREGAASECGRCRLHTRRDTPGRGHPTTRRGNQTRFLAAGRLEHHALQRIERMGRKPYALPGPPEAIHAGWEGWPRLMSGFWTRSAPAGTAPLRRVEILSSARQWFPNPWRFSRAASHQASRKLLPPRLPETPASLALGNRKMRPARAQRAEQKPKRLGEGCLVVPPRIHGSQHGPTALARHVSSA
jgi:hypothetical protein